MGVLKYVNNHTIVDGVNFTAENDGTSLYVLKGTETLTGNWNVLFPGVLEDTVVNILWIANITHADNSIVILGTTIPRDLVLKDFLVRAHYIDSAWKVVILPDFEETDMIDGDTIVADSLPVTAIADGVITLPKLADQEEYSILSNSTVAAGAPTALAWTDESILIRESGSAIKNLVVGAGTIVGRTAAGNLSALSGADFVGMTPLASASIFIGSAANISTAQVLAGDATITLGGVMTIANDAITTVKILNDNVTTAKIADNNITYAKIVDFGARGNILRGGVAGAPEEHVAVTSGQVLLGDGTDITSTPISGLFTLSGAGVATIIPYAISTRLFSDLSVYNTSGGVLETMASYTLAAGVLVTNGDSIEIVAYGTTAATAGAKLIEITFGGATVTVNNTTGSPNALDFIYRIKIFRTSNTTYQGVGTISFDAIAEEIDVIGVGGALDFDAATTVIACNGTPAVGADIITLNGFEVILNKA